MDRPTFKSYYDWEHQPVSEIINRWANDNEQLYDPFMSGHEPKGVHGYYNIYDILPYREYIWTKEDARRSPEKWEELKESIRSGWYVDGPINIMIGKNRVAKVGEGNHRLAVALELIEEEGLEVLQNVPVFFGFWTTVNLNPGLRTPEERDIGRQRDLEEKQDKKELEEEPVLYEEDEETEELMKMLLSKHMRKAIKRLALTINKDELSTLWYENEDGEKYFPDLEKGVYGDEPEGFIYQCSQFPNELTFNMLRSVVEDEVKNCPHPEEELVKDHGLIDGLEGRECSLCHGQQTKDVGEEWPEEWEAYGSRDLLTGHSGWQEDLVLAIATSGDYTLSEAILISANSCERCMNSLAEEYGLDWGYLEGSDEWKKCGTECSFCKDMGHTRNGPDFLEDEE